VGSGKSAIPFDIVKPPRNGEGDFKIKEGLAYLSLHLIYRYDVKG
jgi:hypothetical protein